MLNDKFIKSKCISKRNLILSIYFEQPSVTSFCWVIAVGVVDMVTTVWHSTTRSRALHQGAALWEL